MKRFVLITLLLGGIIGSASAQRDDLYFVPKKKTKTERSTEKSAVSEVEEVVSDQAETLSVAAEPTRLLEIDEDAYNRRGSYLTEQGEAVSDFTMDDDGFVLITEEGDTMWMNTDTLRLSRVADDDGWIGGFDGSDSDYEYAMRIVRFRNPRYAIPVSSPLYWDVVYGNALWPSWEWNIYDDGVYAYVFPTSINRFYMDYSYGWGYHWPYYPNYAYRYHYGWPHAGHLYYNPWYGPGWHHSHYYHPSHFHGYHPPRYHGYPHRHYPVHRPGVGKPVQGGGKEHPKIRNSAHPSSSHHVVSPNRISSNTSSRINNSSQSGSVTRRTDSSSSRQSSVGVVSRRTSTGASSSSVRTSGGGVTRQTTGTTSTSRNTSTSSDSRNSYTRPVTSTPRSSTTTSSSRSSSSSVSRISSGSSSRSYSSGSSYSGGSSSRSSMGSRR